MTSFSDIAARQQRSMAMGDALGTVIYRPPTPLTTFVDAETGEIFSTDERERYRNTRSYKERRAHILARKNGCDHCGAPASVVWAEDVHAMGNEDVDNTVALCRHCNNRAYRARQQLGLVA